MSDQPLTVHDMIHQLTATHPHAEPYTLDREDGEKWQTRHHTRIPALVAQLVGASPQGSQEESGASHGKSRPAARIEALDTVILIDTEAGDWIDRLGGVIPADRIDPRTQLTIVGSGTILRLRRVNGLYPATDTCGRSHHNKTDHAWCCARGHLTHDVRRWWQQARIITGWDTPAFRPRGVTCPICDVKGSLRVKPEAALCVECRSLWDGSQIGLLAEHIRTEAEEAA